MKPEQTLSKDEDYTLVELSPHETLVKFSDGSPADPNSWTFVSISVFIVKRTEKSEDTNRQTHRIKGSTTPPWA